ncbi:MAG: FAD-binding oxidoreductase [Chloroflexota bacterium]|nr:FAD-binding oxidoreductase [Chloroflexota bacterium]
MLITERRYALGEKTPSGGAVRPQSPEVVALTLREADEAGRAVVPWGAGTKQGFGNTPRAYDVALDLTGLSEILEYEPADLVVTAQAGTPLATLQRRLGEAGQFLALDPPYADQATLGGTLATNASGPSRLLYGTARDLVLGMKVATPGGDLVKSGGKVVKNVVGYDLNKMHIGGLGTLGIMVEVTFKVHPLPRAEATLAATFDGLGAAHATAGRIYRSVLYPRAVELVRAAGRWGGEGRDAAPGAWQVLVWASGSPATVERQVRDATAWCQEAGAVRTIRLDGADHDHAWHDVREFGRALPADAALIKLTALPTQVAAVIRALDQSAEQAIEQTGGQGAAGGPPELIVHAGTGVIYVTIRGASAPGVQKLMRLAIEQGGGAVIEAAPAEVKAEVDVWGPTRDDFPLMQALKAQFDPHGALNPGRFVGRI